MERLKRAAVFAVALAIVLLSACCAFADLSDIDAVFNHACDLYEDGDFEAAAGQLESLAASGVRDADVYYNLGNCYYKQGELGKAVANYRRAMMLAPRDSDAEENLDLIRSFVGFRDTTGSYGIGSIVAIPLDLVSPQEFAIAFYAAYYLAVLTFLGVVLLRGNLQGKCMYTLVVLVAVAATAYGLSRHGISRFGGASEGVITAEGTEFMSGPGTAFDELVRLPDGVEIHLRARSGIWIEVELDTGDIGWVRETDLERI
jgi:hypothetical protein